MPKALRVKRMSRRCSRLSGELISDQKLVSKYDSSFMKGDYQSKLMTEIYRVFTEFLKTHYGIMTLIEAFVKYNQLRGGDYVTPKEFHDACMKLSSVGSDIIVEQLESGVFIIRLGFLMSEF
jgi:hypothetical protein